MDRLKLGYRYMSLRGVQRSRRRRYRRSPVERQMLQELEPDVPDPEYEELLAWARMYLDAQRNLLPSLRVSIDID